MMMMMIIMIINQYKNDDDDDDNNNNKVLNTETDSKCRLCQQFDETIDHIISACPILAKEQYIKDMIQCVHSYTSTYSRQQRYNWTKNTGRNMCHNQ